MDLSITAKNREKIRIDLLILSGHSFQNGNNDFRAGVNLGRFKEADTEAVVALAVKLERYFGLP